MRAPDPEREPLQQRALLAFLTMTEATPDWSGRLVMLSASEEAAAFALAALASGSAVLWTCAEEPLLRESGIRGLTDFQVTTLSEALRILKNEIRKGTAVSAGVLDRERSVWSEAVRRGLQPGAVLADSEDRTEAEAMLERGAEWLEVRPGPTLLTESAATWRERRACDEALLAGTGHLLEPERSKAVRWLGAAPRLFPREMVRCYPASWSASNETP